MAPVFLPIAIFGGHLFRSYEDRDIQWGTGSGRRFLYDLPIILQAVSFIAILILIPFTKKLKLDVEWANVRFENGWGLIVLPIVFQVMMIFLPAYVKKKWERGWFLTITVLSALFLISMHFMINRLLAPCRSAYSVSQAIHVLVPPDHELFQVGTSLYGIDFYNKIRTPLVGRPGEQEFGSSQLPPDERSRYYLTLQALFKRCKESGEIYCVTRHKQYAEMEAVKCKVCTLEVLWDNGEFFLLRLRC